MANQGEEASFPAPDALQSVDPSTDTTNGLSQVSSILQTNALVGVNAQAAPVAAPAVVLQEKQYSGYSRGPQDPRTFTGVQIDGLIMERTTGYDYIYMKQAAAKAGIKLYVSDAFRSLELQTSLRHERYDPPDYKVRNALGKKLGQVAEIGYSNHGAGIALDIDMGLTIDAFLAGQRTKTFNWMMEHAIDYGFKLAVGFSYKNGVYTVTGDRPEPWHFEHNDYKIVGSPTPGATYVDTSRSSVAATKSTRGIDQFVNRDVHDRVQAANRSQSMMSTARDDHWAGAAAAAIGGAAQANLTAGSFKMTQAWVDAKPPELSPADQSATSYDFEHGVWGDGKPT